MRITNMYLCVCLCCSTVLILSTENTAIGSSSEVKDTFKPVVSWLGSYSSIDKVKYHRITTKKQWASLWADHKGKLIEHDSYGQPVVPFVNFEKYMVLGIFRGNAWNIRSQEILDYQQSDDIIEIHFDSRTYQTDGPAEDKDYTRAYGIWVLPRTNMQITLIENVQGLLGKPPKWKLQHTFKAIED